MKIGFVAEPYEESHASGMGFVVSELLKNLLTQGNEHEFVVYSSKQVNPTFIPGRYKTALLPKGLINKLRWFRRIPCEVDVLLFVAPLLPLVPPKDIRSIVICQELASQKIRPGIREWPLAFVRDYLLMPLCLRRADAIVAASHATKKDILKFYNVADQKVQVIYDGYQDLRKFEGIQSASMQYVPYFFFAGKVKPRKNVHGIASAFVEFKKRTQAPVKLVIAGEYGGGYYEQIMKKLQEGGVETDVHFVGYLQSPAELCGYFKHALAVTFPSINEGFGMPIIEAMSLGTPVITSNISSMAEAAGDAALLVDPFDTRDISRAMEKIYLDQAFRESLIAKGYVRAKYFSWEKAAREFLQLIESHE